MKTVQVVPKAGIQTKLKKLLKETERQLRGAGTTFYRQREGRWKHVKYPGWIKWVFLVSLIPAGIFAISYKTWFIKLRSLWRYQRMTRRKNEQLLHLKSLRKHILDRAEELIPA